MQVTIAHAIHTIPFHLEEEKTSSDHKALKALRDGSSKKVGHMNTNKQHDVQYRMMMRAVILKN